MVYTVGCGINIYSFFRVIYMNIYDRQKSLELHIPSSIAVIGVGGIGSWVALDFALVGVKKIIVVDHDIVEDTNLNRTPFTLNHINVKKVEAIAELIYERRNDCDVIPIDKKIEELNDMEKSYFDDVELVVDCRDVKKTLPDFLNGRRKVALGYDGFRVTIHYNPSYGTLWGQSVRYTVIPSFLIPPQVASALAVLSVVSDRLPREEKIIRFDVRELLKY